MKRGYIWPGYSNTDARHRDGGDRPFWSRPQPVRPVAVQRPDPAALRHFRVGPVVYAWRAIATSTLLVCGALAVLVFLGLLICALSAGRTTRPVVESKRQLNDVPPALATSSFDTNPPARSVPSGRGRPLLFP